ncbi:alanine racemase [Nocardioides pinisoli]|uniref:Alanine racemase n=1 Tax=Nocardioides pinisoli TaxID=2950279 RepID=A0ABT1KT04_9ACTN|nr:alanine racemase [Nocardioides pinisoli]MCP3420875.1 alanine racemase [Nocardioides pinisoli]
MHTSIETSASPQSVDPALAAWREVDLDAIGRNVRALADIAAPASLMVVIKADAYSHGSVEVARAAVASGADHLGVAVLEEAFELRSAGITAPVLAWLAGPGARYAEAVACDVSLAAYSCAQVEEIARAAASVGGRAQVHLKAETGMWRGGAAAGEWRELVDLAGRLQRRGTVDVVGVWSHLACADEPRSSSNDAQLRLFLDAVEVAGRAGLEPSWRHLANSAATLSRPDMHFDLVRCGLAVYGVDPLAGHGATVGLEQAMTLKGTVTHVKEAPAGAGVSYGHTYRTSTATRLALVPLGYADGIPVAPGTAVRAGWRGHPVPLAGRVCMDQLVVDVGDLPVQPGDEVTLLGPGRDGEHTVRRWSDLTGRSTYELLTGLDRRRVPLAHVRRT